MAATCSSDSVERAARLARTPVRAIRPGGRGGNNRLERVEAEDGRSFALKSYPRTTGDARDRLGVEFAALSFLAANGIVEVPAALARDDEAGQGLYEWIEGVPVDSPAAADVDAALAFAARLHALRHAAAAARLPWASEACVSGAELIRQAESRLVRLRQVAAGHPGLGDLLEAGIAPILQQSAEAVTFGPLAPECRTLSPADFGFHNALRRPDGSLAFLDFEYFGWDDPVKLAAEFPLHPGQSLDETLRARWREGIARVYEDVPEFHGRLAAFRPLFVARWALIVLNEFLPERWARRVAAGETDGAAARIRQLAKAAALLERVNET
ncbi:phosphotransferase [Magnetospirillum sp. SS-4]|uniref:phosphotransferase n=1 Tax=Magnetospirillum sp. SS-4 TaxID=2681465 RepID=UPI001380877C|nr:phosphotransferase [Magnetospirillum sp. SS-4]CAA7614519.1 conserved hypothetical protein [Magnetospirillum sp. SS-4]